MKVAVIGGSGLYDIDGLENKQEFKTSTPFGEPSDAYITGVLNGVETVFLARHGRGHHIMPGELNHQANIYGLKELGVEKIISISAVGSFREDMSPGDIVLCNQFVDRTKRASAHTFFGDGIVAHISMAHPTCDDMRATLTSGINSVIGDDSAGRSTLHCKGTYLNMEGPAFSTRAESQLYKSWGMDVIGMTNFAEAKLAREAELCYQTVAMVTDFDCWHEGHDAVTVDMIISTLTKNAALAKDIIREVVPALAEEERRCACKDALATAIVTNPTVMPQATKEKLGLLITRYVS
jgi:5'-methylthioadenosine phosphorylase